MSLRIFIDTPGPFYPGSKIQGRLICTFDNSQKIRGIKMIAYGEEHTEWWGTESYYCERENRQETRSVLCQGDNTLFRLETMLFGGHSGDHHVGPGTFTYPFSFQLPLDLPSTFDNKYGHVRYTLKGVVDVPWGFDFTEKVHFLLFSLIDLNNFPLESFQPVSRNDGKTITCCCFASGRITVDINISKTAFVPGETIQLYVALTNMSNTNVEALEAKLVQQIRSLVHTPSYDSMKVKNTLACISMSGVGAHGENNYDIGIPIPSDMAVPNLDRCTLFEVYYDVQISVNIPGFHSDLDLSFSVNIGHIQNNSQLTGSPPAGGPSSFPTPQKENVYTQPSGGVPELGYPYPGQPYATPGGLWEFPNRPYSSAPGATYPSGPPGIYHPNPVGPLSPPGPGFVQPGASAPTPHSAPGEPPYPEYGSQRTTHPKENEAMKSGVSSAPPNELPPPSYSEVTKQS